MAHDSMRETLRVNRREALGALGGMFGAAVLIGCGSSTSSPADGGGVVAADGGIVTPDGGGAGSCVLIPQETAGPFPLSAVLSNETYVRQNITEGNLGVPLTLNFELVNVNASCAPIAGAAIYAWHCDKDGQYSGYSGMGMNTVGQTFLRGIQLTGADGRVSFTSIFPGWYSGRITHVHFQVFLNNQRGNAATATSQLGFPPAITSAVYGSAMYSAKGQNTSVASFSQDNVFSDGTTHQIATVSGDTASGLTSDLRVGVSI